MGSKAPGPSKEQNDLTLAQAQAMKDQTSFDKEQFAWMKGQAETQQKLGLEQFDRQMALADKADSRSDEQWKLYQDTTGKQTRAFSDQVDQYDTAAAREQIAGSAMTDIGLQMNAARGQMGRNFAARGLNPGSAAYTMAMGDMGTTEALGKASAGTMASQAARAEGLQLRAQAAGLGAGAGAMGMSGLGMSGSLGMSGLGASGAGMGAMGQAMSSYNQGQGTAIGWGNSAQGGFNSMAQQAQAASQTGFGATLGTIAGSFAGGLGGSMGAAWGSSLFPTKK